MALGRALPRARATPELGTFTQDPSRVRDDDLAARRSTSFTCPHGHDFTILFADNATVPAAWECRRHSITAGLKDTAYPHQLVKKRRHWDIVLERRSKIELAQLLNQQLKALRAGRLIPVEQWLKMRNEQDG